MHAETNLLDSLALELIALIMSLLLLGLASMPQPAVSTEDASAPATVEARAPCTQDEREDSPLSCAERAEHTAGDPVDAFNQVYL